jgi:hypothetical protein
VPVRERGNAQDEILERVHVGCRGAAVPPEQRVAAQRAQHPARIEIRERGDSHRHVAQELRYRSASARLLPVVRTVILDGADEQLGPWLGHALHKEAGVLAPGSREAFRHRLRCLHDGTLAVQPKLDRPGVPLVHEHRDDGHVGRLDQGAGVRRAPAHARLGSARLYRDDRLPARHPPRNSGEAARIPEGLAKRRGFPKDSR